MYEKQNDYSGSMDRTGYAGGGYGPINPDSDSEAGFGPIPVSEIGISTHPAKDQVAGLKARIFQGAKKVELGFMGRGKGSMQQGNTTPEMYGRDERQDIKELADYNKVQLSVHTSPAVGTLSGFTDRGFNEQARQQVFNEIKRTIDFAKDTTHGGAIVVHTGEFPRPFVDAEWNKNGNEKFTAYPEEKEKAEQYVVDKRTGEIIVKFGRDQLVYEPVFLTAKDVQEKFGIKCVGIKDEKTGKEIKNDDFVDMQGNLLDLNNPEDLFRRVPDWNKEKNKFEVKQRDWKYFDEKAEEWNKDHDKENWKTPAQIFAETQLDNQIFQYKGQSLYYAQDYDEMRETIKRMDKAYEYYKQLESNIPQEERWKIAVQKHFGHSQASVQLIPSEPRDPSQILDEEKKMLMRRMTHIHEASAAADARAQELFERRQRMEDIGTYAIKRTADTISRAAEEAMAKSKNLDKPLYISPENIFPEQYGAHPQELKELIQKSRDAFIKSLVDKKMATQSEAVKLAETHIRATFDLGHAYTWRKYFKGSDKEFNNWLIDQVEDLTKEKIIGHIHVSDNFGYEDEHVTPGQGNVPIPELLQKLKDKGLTDVIVEPAHQDYLVMLGGWKQFGGPVYGVAPGTMSWSDIDHSYFGHNAPPYFLYGDAAPNPQDWSLWSQSKLE